MLLMGIGVIVGAGVEEGRRVAVERGVAVTGEVVGIAGMPPLQEASIMTPSVDKITSTQIWTCHPCGREAALRRMR